MSIEFSFKEERTAQAAVFLIQRNNNKLNYMKLIKLLYLADREALLRWQEPISGDTYFSLERGPILSTVLDKISYGPDPDNPTDYWASHIIRDTTDSYAVVTLNETIDFDELSARELDLLAEIDDTFKTYSQWDMVEYCHTNLPEWENPLKSRIPLPIETILNAAYEHKNKSSDEKSYLLDLVAFKAGIDSLQGGVARAAR